MNLLNNYNNERNELYKMENLKIYTVVDNLSKTCGVKNEDIDITDLKLINNVKGIINEIAYFDMFLIKDNVNKVLNDINIINKNDLLQLIGLLASAWTTSIAELTKEYNINELPFRRDEIYIYLTSHNVEQITALEIMEFIRKGRANKKNYKLQWMAYIEIMKRYNITDKYIRLLEHIRYSCSDKTVNNYYKLILWLSYYKVNYTDEYHKLLQNIKTTSTF